jgi:hypothetical protein
MSNNLLLPPLIVFAAYHWYQRGFPRSALMRRLGVSPEQVLVTAGLFIILVLGAYSLGELWLGAVQVSRDLSVDYYVHRTEDAFIFWSQIALQLTLGFATGGALIAIGRRDRRPPVPESSRNPAS